MSFTVLDKEYVMEHLDIEQCISLMRDTLKKEQSGECIQYLRTAIPLPNTNVIGMMPGWFGDYFGVKVLSVYHTNSGTGFPSHQGQILLFRSEHGELIASIDASSVTQIRTGAVSAAASLYLARPESEHIAILGCGAQGKSHLLALLKSYSVKTVSLWDPYRPAAEKLAAEVPVGITVQVCEDVKSATENADIICTVTPSKTPILKKEWVKPGAHINAVGACAPDARELDSELVASARFFCDNVESVLHESGDYLFPLREGKITSDHILGTVGQVANGVMLGRQSDQDITIFEALGMAVEDLAAAKFVYDLSRKENL